MILPASFGHFPAMLDLQIECVRGLEGVYETKDIEAWISYLSLATHGRFAVFYNRIYVDENNRIVGFVSWSKNELTNIAHIECLYVRKAYRGRGIGHFLLHEAESHIEPDKKIIVRSPLNARSFYEQNGYTYSDDATSLSGFRISVLEKLAPIPV